MPRLLTSAVMCSCIGLDVNRLPSIHGVGSSDYEGGDSYDDENARTPPLFIIELALEQVDDDYEVVLGLRGSGAAHVPLQLLSVVGGFVARDSPGVLDDLMAEQQGLRGVANAGADESSLESLHDSEQAVSDPYDPFSTRARARGLSARPAHSAAVAIRLSSQLTDSNEAVGTLRLAGEGGEQNRRALVHSHDTYTHTYTYTYTCTCTCPCALQKGHMLATCATRLTTRWLPVDDCRCGRAHRVRALLGGGGAIRGTAAARVAEIAAPPRGLASARRA